jgi:hypothetical protein
MPGLSIHREESDEAVQYLLGTEKGTRKAEITHARTNR